MTTLNLKVCLILLVLTLSLTSCVKSGIDNIEVPVIEERSSETYPVGDNSNNENNPDSPIVPTPSSGASVFFGGLYSAENDLPASFVKIYFATKIFLTPGPGYMLSYEENGSPHTQTDENGNFVISDILPGEYFLIMVTPVNSYSVIDKNDNQVTVLAEEGKIYDLGKLFVNWP